jgi:hypothetical protein
MSTFHQQPGLPPTTRALGRRCHYSPTSAGAAAGRRAAEHQARTLFGPNVLVMFGGSKDGAVGQTRISRTNWQTGAMAGRTFTGEDIAILRPEVIRRLGDAPHG